MSKGTKEIPISDEDYAYFEKIAKQKGITVDELCLVSVLCLAYKYDRDFYEEQKKKIAPHLRKHLEVIEKA